MSGHTQGPWNIETYHKPDTPANGRVAMTIRAKAWDKSDLMGDYRGNTVCSFVESHGHRPHAFDEVNANANLIVAAHDLRDACISARDVLERWCESEHCVDESQFMPVLNSIRAALEKAEGFHAVPRGQR